MEKVRYELIRFDPKGLGKNEPLTERRYYVARFTHDHLGNFGYVVPDCATTFSYQERIRLLKVNKKRERRFQESSSKVSPSFSEIEKSKLRSLRRAIQMDGMTEFLVDFIPRYSIDSVLRELNN